MYVGRHAINVLMYLSVGLRVQEYGTLKFHCIDIVYASLTRHFKLFVRHKLLSKCFATPLTFRAIVRDLPTLLHKVNNAEYIMFHKCPIYIQCHLSLWFMYSVAMV